MKTCRSCRHYLPAWPSSWAVRKVHHCRVMGFGCGRLLWKRCRWFNWPEKVRNAVPELFDVTL